MLLLNRVHFWKRTRMKKCFIFQNRILDIRTKMFSNKLLSIVMTMQSFLSIIVLVGCRLLVIALVDVICFVLQKMYFKLMKIIMTYRKIILENSLKFTDFRQFYNKDLFGFVLFIMLGRGYLCKWKSNCLPVICDKWKYLWLTYLFFHI